MKVWVPLPPVSVLTTQTDRQNIIHGSSPPSQNCETIATTKVTIYEPPIKQKGNTIVMSVLKNFTCTTIISNTPFGENLIFETFLNVKRGDYFNVLYKFIFDCLVLAVWLRTFCLSTGHRLQFSYVPCSLCCFRNSNLCVISLLLNTGANINVRFINSAWYLSAL